MAASYSYIGTGARANIRRSDGLEFPQDPGSVAYQDWLAYTAAGGVTEVLADPTLEQQRERARRVVNERASEARLEFTQVLGEDDLARWLRLSEAQDFELATSPQDADYPLLAAEVPDQGADVDAVHDVVLTEANILKDELAQIEAIREGAQAALDSASTTQEIQDVLGSLAFSTRRRRLIGFARATINAPACTLLLPYVMQPGPAFFAIRAIALATPATYLIQPDPAAVRFIAVPTAESGWLNFPPSVDSRIIYVSSSLGDDGNSGLDEAHPKRTVAAGRALMRDTYPDHLRLKCGDTWTNDELGNWSISGRSFSEKMVVESYGTGPRPLLRTGTDNLLWGHASHFALDGLEATAHAYNGTNGNPQCITLFGPAMTDVVLQDLYLHNYSTIIYLNGSVGGGGANTISSVVINRICAADAWATNGGANTTGILVGNTSGILINESWFDKCGWINDADYSQFDHTLYIQNQCTDALVTGCLWANTDGMQLRPGGVCTTNLSSRCVGSFTLGVGNTPEPDGVFMQCEDCVALEGRDHAVGGSGGWAFSIGNVASGTFKRCIAANGSQHGARFIWWRDPGVSPAHRVMHNTAMEDLISYDWGGGGFWSDIPDQAYFTGNTATRVAIQNPTNNLLLASGDVMSWPAGFTSANLTTDHCHFTLAHSGTSSFAHVGVSTETFAAMMALMGDSTSDQVEQTYPHPTDARLGSYNASLGGSSGDAGHDEFMTRCRQQSRQNYDRRYTAAAAIEWVKSHCFGVSW